MSDGKAAPSKGAAARSEKANEPKPKSYTWRGLKLKLPPKLSGELLWDFAEFEADEEAGRERVGPMITLLRSLVGTEQSQAIREKVAEDGIDIDQVGDELYKILDGVLKKYGLSMGEA